MNLQKTLSLVSKRNTSLTQRTASTDITPREKENPKRGSFVNEPQVKKLNLLNLGPQTDRSCTSRLSNNTEGKDIVTLLNERNGKSFLALLKEINFSLKMIRKINRMYSPFAPFESNSSFLSDCSELGCSFQSKTFERKSHLQKEQKQTNIENFLTFKTFLFVPMISLNGEVENFFEISKNEKEGALSYVSFSTFFDYFETLYVYLINLFNSLKYNERQLKNIILKFSVNSTEISKMKIKFNPNEKVIFIYLYYVSENFVREFVNLETGINSNQVEIESLGFIFGLTDSIAYELTLRAISLKNENFIAWFYQYLTSEQNHKLTTDLLNSLATLKERYLKSYSKMGELCSFSILLDGDNSCLGYQIRIKTSHDLLVSTPSVDIRNSSSGKKSQIKINSKYGEVKFIIVSYIKSKMLISYEYLNV